LSRSADVPSWWPARWYYGWALVLTLGLTAAVSYGVLAYAFAVFVTPMSEELGWSKATITGAFSVAQLVAGLAAIPAGRWMDRNGGRALMTLGSVFAAILLIAWSRVHSVVVFYVVWALLGVVSAAVLYEPAFVVVTTWFRRDRARAFTVLTVIGGLSSIIFVPLTTLLVERFGWRSALLWMAGISLVLAALPQALVLRRRPSDLGLEPDGDARGMNRAVAGVSDGRRNVRAESGDSHAGVTAREAYRTPAFRWLTVGFALSGLTIMAVTVHFIPLLRERGYSAGFAGAAMGALGLMALPGRLIFTPLGSRGSRPLITASVMVMAALAIVILLVSESRAAVGIFVVLFGGGFGALAPARAALVADAFGASSYGEINGTIALALSVARAAGPIGASLVYEASESAGAHRYDVVLLVLLVLTLASAAAVLASGARRANVAAIPAAP
jgi:MFS family permease